MADLTLEEQAEFDRALEIVAKHFTVVSIYSPDDEVWAMHWAVSEEVLYKSCVEMLENKED